LCAPGVSAATSTISSIMMWSIGECDFIWYDAK
jgi:hypothetical protein